MSIDILGWEKVNLSDKKYFKIIGSGVNYFKGTKNYYSTSSVDGNKVLNPEGEFTYFNRPSRANMQPSNNTVWFAKMKNTLKVIKCSERFNANSILSTGFSGIYSDKVLAEYLEQIFLSEDFNVQKDNLSEGSTQQAINNSKLKDIYVDIPLNLNEQKKIAEILTKVDEAIENTEQLIQKYEQVKVGLMQDLLTKGIDENGNIRSEETHQFKDSPLGRIPVEWDCDKLDAFLSKKQYGISLPLTDNGKYSVLRMNNIKYGELFLKDVKYTSDFFPKDLILKEGDVLFNRTNSIEHVGRTGIFRKQEGEYTFASYLVRLSPNDKLNCEFLNLLLNFNTNQERIKAIATSAVHQANVNPTNLGRLYFSIPKYDEQILIYEHLQKMTKLIIHNRQLKQKLQLQKQGLMQDLLSGKVRVNY